MLDSGHQHKHFLRPSKENSTVTETHYLRLPNRSIVRLDLRESAFGEAMSTYVCDHKFRYQLQCRATFLLVFAERYVIIRKLTNAQSI